MTPSARAIVHVDMDAFYASVEQLDDPSIRGRPVIVGGHSRRGVVAAASYEIREFGVRSAMSMVEALQRCSHAVVVPVRMSRYAEVSAQVFEVFRRYTPLVEGLSLDEAFLDVTGSHALFGDEVTIAKRIKADIREVTGLTGSAGVAPSKFVAKIASDLDKPDGLVVVAAEGVREFLAPLPLDRMWGVGPKAAARLRSHGFVTIGDLAAAPEKSLEALLGSWGARARALARGEDERPVIPEHDAKSIGSEHTFESDRRTEEELHEPILAQSATVAARLMGNGLRASTLTLKIKYGDHTLCTRQMQMPEAVNDTDSIYEAACTLLMRIPNIGRGVRLTGVSAGGLASGPAQVGLFPDARRERSERIEAVTADLRERFGQGALIRARLVRRDED